MAANDLAFAFLDRFPVSRGHTLVVTRRVTPDWFSATADECTAILALVEVVKRQLDDELHADCSVRRQARHLHVARHRFQGDEDDPRSVVESRETDRLAVADRRIELGLAYPLRSVDAAALR